MRILVDYRPALRERTGVGEYIHRLAEALIGSKAEAGESLTLFSSSWKDRLSPDVIPGATVVDRRVPVRALNWAWHRLEQPPVEWLSGQSFDVVQSAHPLLIPSRSAAQVVFVPDLDFLDRLDHNRSDVRRDYTTLAASHAQRAACVLTISRHTAADIERRLGVPASRISIAYPGAPEWRPRTIEPARGTILFLGTLEPRKNVGVLLDAYERLLARYPEAPTLVLAGRVPDTAGALASRAASLPLKGRVEMPGYVTDEGRRELYDNALIFVMPSHTEGFGLPVVEAMRTGVPVVAANGGALPEAVGDAGLLFDPSDAGTLAQHLETLIVDPAKRAVLREAGWQRARQFTWAATARQVRDAWALASEAHRRRG